MEIKNKFCNLIIEENKIISISNYNDFKNEIFPHKENTKNLKSTYKIDEFRNFELFEMKKISQILFIILLSFFLIGTFLYLNHNYINVRRISGNPYDFIFWSKPIFPIIWLILSIWSFNLFNKLKKRIIIFGGVKGKTLGPNSKIGFFLSENIEECKKVIEVLNSKL